MLSLTALQQHGVQQLLAPARARAQRQLLCARARGCAARMCLLAAVVVVVVVVAG
jgi:hypothetical protein